MKTSHIMSGCEIELFMRTLTRETTGQQASSKRAACLQFGSAPQSWRRWRGLDARNARSGCGELPSGIRSIKPRLVALAADQSTLSDY
jgi:hypothetical protein